MILSLVKWCQKVINPAPMGADKITIIIHYESLLHPATDDEGTVERKLAHDNLL